MPTNVHLAADATSIFIYVPYSLDNVDKCKALPGRLWNKDDKRWEVPNDPAIIVKVVGTFPGASHSPFFKRCMQRVFEMPPEELRPGGYRVQGVLVQNTSDWKYIDRDGYLWEVLASGHPAREYECTSCQFDEGSKSLAEIFCAELNRQICLPCFESYCVTKPKAGPSKAQKERAQAAAIAAKPDKSTQAFIKTILSERKPLI